MEERDVFGVHVCAGSGDVKASTGIEGSYAEVVGTRGVGHVMGCMRCGWVERGVEKDCGRENVAGQYQEGWGI